VLFHHCAVWGIEPQSPLGQEINNSFSEGVLYH